MKPWNGLADFIEDSRHLTMKLRCYMTRNEIQQMGVTPRILVNVSNRAAEAQKEIDRADQEELDLSNYLVHQYEEALTFLTSMIPD